MFIYARICIFSYYIADELDYRGIESNDSWHVLISVSNINKGLS